jgi:hypothetical protein
MICGSHPGEWLSGYWANSGAAMSWLGNTSVSRCTKGLSCMPSATSLNRVAGYSCVNELGRDMLGFAV